MKSSKFLITLTLLFIYCWSIDSINVHLLSFVDSEDKCRVIDGINLEECSCDGDATYFQNNRTNSIDDCSCQMSDVDTVNNLLFPILEKLVNTTYFKYYKLNLWRPCAFFPEDGTCALRTCAVDECEKSEFFDACGNDPDMAKLNEEVDLSKFVLWKECGDDPWTIDADAVNSDEDMNYFDLQKNPERFTGYQGNDAHRIWKAIYSENCFLDNYQFESDPSSFHDVCVEKRVFYRLISGLHTSISTHLTYDHLIDPEFNIWGPNYEWFYNSVGRHPARLKNLYFTYLFLLRSVTKIMPNLKEHDFITKSLGEPAMIRDMMKDVDSVLQTCTTFDETIMFNGDGAPLLKKQFKEHFRNISAILDCVSCEKCKLWGKLQINGLGTSLKILFDHYQNKETNTVGLQRTEIIALFNTLKRLSESIKWSKEMMDHISQEKLFVDEEILKK